MRKFVFLFFIILFSFLYSKEELRPYRLINADSLIVEKKNDFYHTDLIGNVHFFYGDTEFFCDRAIVDEERKITIMQGNVKVYEDTLSLFAQNSEYHRNDEKIFLNNDVKIVQLLPDSTKNIFWAEHITYQRNDSLLTAQVRVKALSEKENITARCGFLKYNLKSHYGYLLKKPFIQKKEKDKIFSVSAEKIEYFDDYKKVVASFNVHSKFEDYLIISSFLLYFSDEEKAVVIGSPEFISKEAKATAGQFIFYLQKNKLKTADLTDSCKVYYKISESDSLKRNYVFADKIKLNFENGELNNMTALGEVQTFYVQDKSKNQDFAKNYVNGDSLFFKMKDNKIESIFLKKGREGRYYFEKN